MQKYKDLASQLPVWQFVGNFLAFSDHSFGAGFKIQGVDISCMDTQEINLIVDRLEKLLISLEPGTKIQVLYKLTSKVFDKIDDPLALALIVFGEFFKSLFASVEHLKAFPLLQDVSLMGFGWVGVQQGAVSKP